MTPTVIRHATRGEDILQVITYMDGQHLSAVFQTYTYNADTGRTTMRVSQQYTSENGAVQAWQLAMMGK